MKNAFVSEIIDKLKKLLSDDSFWKCYNYKNNILPKSQSNYKDKQKNIKKKISQKIRDNFGFNNYIINKNSFNTNNFIGKKSTIKNLSS